MRRIAFYEKGGIGKSTLTSSIAVATAGVNKRVMQIGCDPKADSTSDLRTGQEPTSVMDVLQAYGGLCPGLDAISVKGYRGIVCVETGGPTPGSGYAGRGIIKIFDTLDDFNTFQVYTSEYVFFDVPSGTVYSGFAVLIRQKYADEVVIMTSGEKMALYAATNIKKTLDNFQERGYAKLRRIVLNCQNVPDEIAIVEDFVQRIGTEIIGVVPRDSNIRRAEEQGITMVQMDSELPVSQTIVDIAKRIMVPVEGQKEGTIWKKSYIT